LKRPLSNAGRPLRMDMAGGLVDWNYLATRCGELFR